MIIAASDVIHLSVLLSFATICSASEEFVIVDGIKISKLDFDETKFENADDFVDLKSEERSLEYTLQVKEKSAERNRFPSECHACRLFVEELLRFLNKNGEKEEEREGKPPIFVKNGNVIYRAMQEVCPELKNYRVSRIRHFRYVRGGSTPIREIFNNAQKNSRVKKWMYSVPESELDDPTGEIQRLYSKCETLIETEEDRIINWFFKYQSKDPLEWLCADRVLKKSSKRACLTQSTDIVDKFVKQIETNAKKTAEKRAKDFRKTQNSHKTTFAM
eukprot:gene3222-3700_t